MSELKPKACPVCKGQSGGIGSDGVENDCMACFKREMKAATPRVEACIDAVMARFTGESKAALARYYEEVHQRLAPLARNLELELAEVKAELSRRAQTEANADAKDAERYRWLRHGDNDELVLQAYESNIAFSHFLPRSEKLDAAIDAAIQAQKDGHK